MTENIEQTSAGDRLEAAWKALEAFDQETEGQAFSPHDYPTGEAQAVADALRALITPPSVGESEQEAVDRVLYEWRIENDRRIDLEEAMRRAYRAGIQSAHETWEPEVAQRPSREQMLRWLALDFKESTDDEGEPSIYIHGQHIEREEI